MVVKPQLRPPLVLRHALSLHRVPLPWRLSPERAVLLVREDSYPFALVGRWAGGGALIGSAPVRVASAAEDPFDLLDDQPVVEGTRDGDTAGAPAVGGGWFGWLGYGLGRRIEAIDAGPASDSQTPEFQLAFYDHLLRLDRDGHWWFEALMTAARAAALERRLRELSARAAKSPEPGAFSTDPWRAAPTAAGHGLAVAACRERIHAGDLFQANICARLESQMTGAPIDLFVRALERLRPDRAAFVASPHGAVASLSPELFLERRGRRVRSAPIKGTRAKPSDPILAERARTELMRSDKDRAENVMIVDLVRNDLGRVCQPGSIPVDTLAEVRPHAGVWHLVSEVSGRLRDDVGDAELVRAAFPPGSVSGAPKIAAMNVVAELESAPRVLYTGALGFASPLAGLELSVAIRTFEFRGSRTWLGVGGGIVADSDPKAEAEECLVKAAPLLEAIGAELESTSLRPLLPPLPRRLGPRPLARPEPDAGVFETLLVRDGRPVELKKHLRRLRGSVAMLYGAEPPAGLETDLMDAAWHLGTGRLRVELHPAGASTAAKIVVSPLAERDPLVTLYPLTLPGGLGSHKWIDRRLLDGLGDELGGEPLLCDLDGFVLEAGRANLFLVEPGPRVITPPADGRILPGVTRSRVIELARAMGLEVRQEPVDLARLARADELFLTGSLGGVEPAVLSGLGPPPRSPVTPRLSAAWCAWTESVSGAGTAPVSV